MLNFKITELIKSDLAKKHKISNMPDFKVADNLLYLIYYCLQPVRNLVKRPVLITSGYRSKALNKLVNGAQNSQHLYGQAADFIINGMSVDKIIEIIRNSSIPYDQLINEYDKWVHISFDRNNCRYQILKYI